LSPNTARWLNVDIPQCHEAKPACCQHAHEHQKRCSDLPKQANATCSSSFQANCWHLGNGLISPARVFVQDISRAARERAAGAPDQQFLEEAAAEGAAGATADAPPPAAAIESAYDDELRSELQVPAIMVYPFHMMSETLARQRTLLTHLLMWHRVRRFRMPWMHVAASQA
jgi:hypothetical protein